MSVDHAYEINNKNKDNFWRYEICKKMHNGIIDFEILDLDRHMPVVWNKFTGYTVFDINMYFTRKKRWVLGEHRTLDT